MGIFSFFKRNKVEEVKAKEEKAESHTALLLRMESPL